jgi:hypothetical protein
LVTTEMEEPPELVIETIREMVAQRMMGNQE